jgi:CBS-domain-containing membrane protein
MLRFSVASSCFLLLSAINNSLHAPAHNLMHHVCRRRRCCCNVCPGGCVSADAAALMLKHKVHRIPVVDNEAHVIGMVTRTDIFKALEQDK